VRQPRQPYACPVCNCVPEKLAAILPKTSELSAQERANFREELLKHIAQHLKQIGFLSLVYLDDDADGGSQASRNVSGSADENHDWLAPGKWVEGEWISDVAETTFYWDPQFIDSMSVPRTEPPNYVEDWGRVWHSKQPNAEPYCIEQTLRQLLEFAEKWRGVEHPDTLGCLKDLASWLLREERLEEAEETYRRLYDLCVNILGYDHVDTIVSREGLTQILNLRYDRGSFEWGDTTLGLENEDEEGEVILIGSFTALISPELGILLKSLHPSVPTQDCLFF